MSSTLDPQSPRAVVAAELAREMLSAFSTKDRVLWLATMSEALKAIESDPAIFLDLLAAQTFLTWGSLNQGVYIDLGAEATAEEFKEEFKVRLRALAVGVAGKGWTYETDSEGS